ncbi:MAG: hypothetical protein H0U79_00425, partial [Solirubrobacterales bacterium]|nr:hypothetical protein [Solirubrobacterales bacterium]
PGADAWRGLHALTAHLQGRRALLFDRFGELWLELEREGFRPRLEYALAERAAATGEAESVGAVANGEPPHREGTATQAATLDSA